jgi:hypothetical protein
MSQREYSFIELPGTQIITCGQRRHYRVFRRAQPAFPACSLLRDVITAYVGPGLTLFVPGLSAMRVLRLQNATGRVSATGGCEQSQQRGIIR